jgi:hypothetical protein
MSGSAGGNKAICDHPNGIPHTNSFTAILHVGFWAAIRQTKNGTLGGVKSLLPMPKGILPSSPVS